MSHDPPAPPYASSLGRVQSSTSGVAIAALVCGLGGLLFVPLALAGVVLGVIAVKKPGGSNRGFGLTGIVAGLIGVVLTLLLVAMLAILLPSLNRARHAADRIQCASNMKRIGNALLLYSNDERNGAYPPDLATLARTQPMLTPNDFIDPAGNDKPASGPNWQARLSPGGGNCSFIYYGSPFAAHPRSSQFPDNVPVLSEALSNHHGTGANVLFGDGRVEFVERVKLQRLVPGAK